MPMVKITGVIADHGLKVFDKSLQPRAWFVPNKAHFGETGGALATAETEVTWLNRDTGSFEVEVYSESNNPDIWYTLRVDHLQPGQETEPPENRARSFYEWPQPIYPGEGGNLGDILSQIIGLGLVYVGTDAPNPSRINQLHFNSATGWLYERRVIW